MGAGGGQSSAVPITAHMNSQSGSASDAAAGAAFVIGKMGVLLSSLWTCVTVSVLFLVKFVAARVLRIREGGGAGEQGVSPQKEDLPSLSAEGSSFFQQIFRDEDRDWTVEEPVGGNSEDDASSNLEFKFTRQVSDRSTEDDDQMLETTSRFPDDPVRDNAKATTNVHNYRFASEKGFVGFIHVPEPKTFSIHESYVEDGGHPNKEAPPCDPGLLDKGVNRLVQHRLDEGELVLPESKTSSIHASYVDSHQYEDAQPAEPELLDRELKGRVSSVKSTDQQIQPSSDDEQVVLPESWTFSTHQSHVDGHQYEDAQPYDPDMLDRDLKDRFSSVKCIDQQIQHSSDEDDAVLEHGSTEAVKQHRSLQKSESVGSNQEVKSGDEDGIGEPLMTESSQTKVLLEERRESIASDGTQTTPRESESSEAFDLESISLSSSDGYSIKDLTAEYDTDDLISDRESCFSGSEDSDFEMEFQGSGKELDELLASDEQSTPREKSRGLDAGFKLDDLPSDDEGTGKDDNDDKASVDLTDHFDKQLDEIFILESHKEVEKLVEEITNKATVITEKIQAEHLEFEKQYLDEDKSGIYDREAGFRGSEEFDEEFIDLGSEKVSFLMNQSRSLSSSEHVVTDKSTLQSVEKGEVETEQEDSHVKGYDSLEETDLKKHKDLDKEEDDELELLWEHQELIEQLKLEIKKAKSIGLPTIQEESDSFKLMEDLKPWKIDAESLQKDPLDELHKFYQSYKERMRKFDILNYQKMYSIGCLKLKDPLKSIGIHKSAIASIFSENLWPCRRHKSEDDPSKTFIKELRSDLENVYVGQMCLSWEFLWWQYEKAQELFKSDHYSNLRYNQVAGEFQQLQVMMQRFLEDEPFQRPRLTYFVKNRCVNRGLLQVPMVREDSAKDNKVDTATQPSLEVTSEDLKDGMFKIIKLFGQFVKSDTDADAPSVMKGLRLTRTHVELQDPSDSELLENIRDSLQKKEKKLNDLLKVGNCLVKKFKKPQEGRLSKDMFYSQVDMKLISRALAMSKISSEQLLWCHKKLSKIMFVNRSLNREPAFLLFPC